jgi:hypothetical protein
MVRGLPYQRTQVEVLFQLVASAVVCVRSHICLCEFAAFPIGFQHGLDRFQQGVTREADRRWSWSSGLFRVHMAEHSHVTL